MSTHSRSESAARTARNAQGSPMTTRTHKTLAALLGVQLVLAGALAAWSARSAIAPSPAPLLAFDRDKIDRVTIEGPDKLRTDLARHGDHWLVTQAGNFAADATLVARLLGRLAALKPGPAVATSREAAERFKVADASYERRIAVGAGSQSLGTVLLGNSLGAHQTFARKAGGHDIVAVDLPTYDAPAKPDDWLDKAVLQVPRGELASIGVAGLELIHRLQPPAGAGAKPAAASAASAPGTTAAPAWRAEGLGNGERLDPAAADKLAGALADLRFNALRGRDEAARKDLTTPELTLRVQRRGAQPVDYRLYKLPGGDDHALVVSSRPETFTLASWQARPLIDAAARKALVPPPK